MKRYWAYIVGTALAGTMLAGHAFARGMPAFGIRTNQSGLMTCFQMTSGTEYAWLKNAFCSISVAVSMPLSADSNGAKTVNVAVKATDNQMWCRAVAESRDSKSFTSSNFVSPTVFNVSTGLVLTGASQVSQGLLLAECGVTPQSSIIQVDWNN
jgi:hypothetical protein